MATVMTLTDRATGEAVYPVTSARCVIDNNGADADTRLKALETAMQDKVGAVPGMGLSHEDYTAQDKAKVSSLPDKVQRALTPSDDFVLSPAGNLSLTEEAKRSVFIKQFTAAGKVYDDRVLAGYDPENAPDADHPFFANDLWMTFEEAIACYEAPRLSDNNTYALFSNRRIRTHMPVRLYAVTACNRTFSGASVEVVHIENLKTSDACFRWCSKLEDVAVYSPNSDSSANTGNFEKCVSLKSLGVNVVYRKSFSIGDSPLISLESMQRIVSKTPDTGAAFTVTVHADTYAKLTGDTTNPAAAALTPQELAQWMEVLTDAVDKNITFATA